MPLGYIFITTAAVINTNAFDIGVKRWYILKCCSEGVNEGEHLTPVFRERGVYNNRSCGYCGQAKQVLESLKSGVKWTAL